MSKIIIAVYVDDGKIQTTFQNENSNPGDISLSIGMLQILINKQTKFLEGLYNENQP